MREFDRDAFLDDLATFVGFETIVCRNPDEFRRADEWVRDLLDGTGAEYTELDCHGLTSSIIRPPGSQRPALLGDGHIEVVPGPPELFTLERRGSRAYGRGAADMKTAALMMVWVLRDLLTSDDHHDFWLVLTEDEEVGSQGGAAVVIDHLVERDLLPSVALIPDGGHDFAYVEKEKGIAAFEVTATSDGGHASRPWLVDNPVETVMAFLGDLQRTFPTPTAEDDWRPSVQLTTIAAGDAANQIPARCDAAFDLRFTEDTPTDVVRDTVSAIADGHGLAPRFSKVDPAAHYPRDAPIGAAYLDVLADVIGREPRIQHSAGASNGRLYVGAADVHVLMSNATAGGAHGRHEWVDVDSLATYYELLHRTVRLVSERTRAGAPLTRAQARAAARAD